MFISPELTLSSAYTLVL